jgi:hypothetical protein
VELGIQSGLVQGQLVRLGVDVQGAALSACVRRRFAFKDDSPDAVHIEHPSQGEAAEASANDREALCLIGCVACAA